MIEAKAVITAKDATGGVFDHVARRLRNLMHTAETANRRVNSAAMRAGGAGRAAAGVVGARGMSRREGGVFPPIIPPIGLGVLGPAAAAYGGVQAVKRYADTDLALTRIGITADATKEQIDGLNKSVRDLAYGSGKSFDEVTKGLESLVAGGLDLDKAMPALPAIAKTAQAAGAEVQDMATTTLALNQSLGISTTKMQSAFDVLVTSGKAGKFELKDMARYMASIAPAAAAIGLKGEEGLKRIVAVLQTIRAGTGSTEEAASSVQNIFAKMESEETSKRFKKFGIDLRKEMKEARKEGKDLLTVFTELTEKATKGDLSKIPQLFSDMEFARGMRALLTFKDVFQDVMNRVSHSAGSAMKDFDKVMERPQAAINRMAESFDRLKESIGKAMAAAGAAKAMDWFSSKLEEGARIKSLPAAERAQFEADKRKRQIIDPQIRELDDKIRQKEEAERKKTEPSWWERMRGKKKLDPLEDRLRNDPQLQEWRMKRFNLDAGRVALHGGEMPPIFTDDEVKKMREAEAEKARAADNAKPEPLPSGTSRMIPRPDLRERPKRLELPPVQGLDAGPSKVDVQGTVDGELNAKITIEDGTGLLKMKSDLERVVKVVGSLQGASNGPGSAGHSSPDAGAASAGSAGAQ
ncbi:putative bacteriophage protein [Nitrobacter sp. Nb-311A]|nr:putative bacteriophage protein [Nitrobacter sp. Nb-311A]